MAAARSYRLIGAPASAQERALSPAKNDEERLLRSGVDEIHQAVEFALSLLRRTLGKIFNDVEIKGWCKEQEQKNGIARADHLPSAILATAQP